jgi:hypothetical protein
VGQCFGHHPTTRHIEGLAPTTVSLVPRRIVNSRTVQQTLQELRWIGDTHGEATVTMLAEFLRLWDSVSDIIMQHGIQDTHVWQWTSIGQYSMKSAYDTARIHLIWSMKENLEILGTEKMSFISMVGSS